MFTQREVLEMIIYGYEQLKTVADERGMNVEELIEYIKERIRCNGDNGSKSPRSVRIMEVKELTRLDSEDPNSRFFPIQKESRKNIMVDRVKIRIK